MANLQADLEALFRVGSTAGLPDGALLERFLDGPAEVAEAAFAAIVGRHAAMVLRTCRQVTGDHHQAEDAAQATFLVLARSARSVRSAGSLAAWLHGVARRVSAKAIADAARRRERERRWAELSADASSRSEPRPEIHEELARLPRRYRLPIILCHLEGLSHAQAAHRIGCPLRTLQTRLARGRERLRTRLIRRGLGPMAGSILAMPAPEPASAAWAGATARLALYWITKGGPATAGEGPAAAALAREVLTNMSIHKLKLGLCVAALAVLAGAGAWSWSGGRTILQHAAGADETVKGPDVVLKGWVVGPGHKPVPGAKVRTPILKTRERAVTTGPEGEFAIAADAFPDFDFELVVEAEGLAPKVFDIKTEMGLRTTPSLDPTAPARTAYLMAASREISPALSLNRGGEVTGRIVREGRPVAGAPLGLWGVGAHLEFPEARSDAEGRFRFPHVPAASPCWIYAHTGSLERAGAVRSRSFRTPDEGASIDLGDIPVEPGRTVSGRVIFADGKVLPANAEVIASADHAWGDVRSKPDRSGRFTLGGLPAGLVSIAVHFPDDQFYAPAGYRLSARNKCRDPLNPYLLMGRVDRDVTGLTILFEPGPQPPASHDPRIMAAYKEAQAGPITGVPPALAE